MCSIIGWYGNIDREEKEHILATANERGRDGYGFYIELNGDPLELRKLSSTIIPEHREMILSSDKVVGNFRATPTTEAESTESNLQPYEGIVHNGTIANDKDIMDCPIDSMVLPYLLRKDDWNYPEWLHDKLGELVGSYAIAFFKTDQLVLACNYKPIYFRRDKHSIQFASTPNMIMYESSPMDPYSSLTASVYYDELYVDKEKMEKKQNNKVLVSASSGLDSTTVAYMLQKKYDVTLCYFTYGCLAEAKEYDRIKKIAEHGNFKLVTIDMPRIMEGTITKGTYHKDKIEGTEYAVDWVSARNLLMLSLLTAYAESNEYGYIAFGGNLEESGAYPDNEQEFGRKFNEILPYSVQNGVAVTLLQPVSTYMKHEIVKLGIEHNVPFNLTWSCYSDEDKHCDNCAPCFMRKTAFERNGQMDPVFA